MEIGVGLGKGEKGDVVSERIMAVDIYEGVAGVEETEGRGLRNIGFRG